MSAHELQSANTSGASRTNIALQRNNTTSIGAILLLLLIGLRSECATIRCLIYERQTGRGIEGVKVIAISQSEPKAILGPAITNDAGDCLMQNIPTGQWQIVAMRAGYATSTALITIEDEDEELNMTLPIEPMPSLHGSVVDERGRPLAKKTLDIRISSRALEMQCIIQTDENGNYRIWLGAPVTIVVGDETLTNMPSQQVRVFSSRAPREALMEQTLRIEVNAAGYRTLVIEAQLQKDQLGTKVDITLTPLSSRISGTLVNQRSQPISGATLELRSVATGISVVSRTDEAGSFQFEDIEPGRYLLSLKGIDGVERVAMQPRLIEVKEGETLTMHLIAISHELVPTVTFELVREEGNVPLSNERVQILMRMIHPQRAYGSSATLVTGANGRCTMPIEREPAIYRTFINLSGWSIIATVDARETKSLLIKLILPKQPQVLCRVKARFNEPFDAYVHIRGEGELFWENIGSTQNGILNIAGLPPGNYEFAATPKSIYAYSEGIHASVFPPLRIKVTDTNATEPIEVVFSMPRCIKLVGNVRMKRGTAEEPLQNATLLLERFSPGEGRLSLTAMSQQDGKFEFSAVPLGTYKLKISHPICDDFEMNLKLEEAAAKEGVFVVSAALNYIGLGRIIGTLVDSDGNPAKNAAVILRKWHESLRGEYEVTATKTKDDGSFILANLRPGRYSIEFWADEAGGITIKNINVEGDKMTDLGKVLLPPPATLIGKVIPYDESIIEDLQVFICVPGTAEQIEAYLQHSISPPESIAKRAFNLGRDGIFVAKLPAGSYEVLIYGKPLLEPISGHIRLNPGEKLPVVLTLPKPAKIEGQIKRVDTGEPVRMAVVTLHSRSGRKLAQTVTDIDGFYRIMNVPPGVYSVRCKGEGLAAGVRHHVQVESGDCAIIDFNLSPGASVFGKITSKIGIGAGFRLYQVIPNADVSLASQITPDGEFRIEHLPPGRHVIMVYRGGELVAAKEVVLREGEEKQVDFIF